VKNEVRFQRKLNSASAQCKRVWYITEKPGTHINLFHFISFPFVIAEGAAGCNAALVEAGASSYT
jgi:hypothetical protein